MAGQCAGNITVNVPTPVYRETVLTGCSVYPSSVLPGESFSVNINIATGNLTEQYKVVLSGDINATSNPFWLGGTSSVTNTMTSVPFTMTSTATAGVKSFTASLIKV